MSKATTQEEKFTAGETVTLFINSERNLNLKPLLLTDQQGELNYNKFIITVLNALKQFHVGRPAALFHKI